MNSFFQVTLRTSDVEAGRSFYAGLLGGGGPLDIVKLHEQAVARGARPHWLGFLEVSDVDRAAAAFVERGAAPLAPKWINPQGLEAAVMRDPGGAVVALAKPPPSTGASPIHVSPEVVWHVLNTADVQRAQLNYGELFGWEFKPPLDLGNVGVAHPFAFEKGAPPVGFLLDIASRPEVHPHWLFHFRVAAVGPAMEKVRAAGGIALGPFTVPTGERVAVCDDPQGAAFAIWQSAS